MNFMRHSIKLSPAVLAALLAHCDSGTGDVMDNTVRDAGNTPTDVVTADVVTTEKVMRQKSTPSTTPKTTAVRRIH